jgi:hypothetical protein
LNNKTLYRLLGTHVEFPFRCEKCGYISLTDKLPYKFYLETPDEFLNLAFKCLKCGYSPNRIDIDLFHLIQDSIEAFEKTSLTDLIILRETLASKLTRDFSIADFTIIQNDISKLAPDFESFKQLQPFNRQDAYQIINIILLVITLYISYLGLPKPEQDVKGKPTLEQVITINKYIQAPTTTHHKKKHKRKPSLTQGKKATLNNPCSCGSGKRFRDCHGKGL